MLATEAVAAIDRDTAHCPAAAFAGMDCVAGQPYAVGYDGRGVGDCIRCGQPTWTARVIRQPLGMGH